MDVDQGDIGDDESDTPSMVIRRRPRGLVKHRSSRDNQLAVGHVVSHEFCKGLYLVQNDVREHARHLMRRESRDSPIEEWCIASRSEVLA